MNLYVQRTEINLFEIQQYKEKYTDNWWKMHTKLSYVWTQWAAVIKYSGEIIEAPQNFDPSTMMPAW